MIFTCNFNLKLARIYVLVQVIELSVDACGQALNSRAVNIKYSCKPQYEPTFKLCETVRT